MCVYIYIVIYIVNYIYIYIMYIGQFLMHGFGAVGRIGVSLLDTCLVRWATQMRTERSSETLASRRGGSRSKIDRE